MPRRRPNSHLEERVVLSFDFPAPGGAYTPGVATVKTITLPAKASITDETTITAHDGFNTVVFGLDVAGDGVAGDDVTIDLSGGSTAAEMGTLVYTALAASNLKGWTFVDNLDGTITATHRLLGTCGNTAWTVTTDPQVTVVNTVTGADPSFTDSTSADATLKLFKAPRAMEIDKVEILSVTGLAQDASNYFNIKLLNQALVAANFSTLTGANGSLTANTFMAMTLGTLANRSVAADSILSLMLDETGTAVMPHGRLVIHARYVGL
jgi:hypothetical protein